MYARHPEKILELLELLLKSDWLGDNINTIFKLPHSKRLKVTFNQYPIAKKKKKRKKSTEKGQLVFNVSILPTDITQEEYIYKTCFMKCYKLEDH